MSSQTAVSVTNNDSIYNYATTELTDATESTESSIPIYFLLYATLMISSIIGAKLLHDRPQLTAVLPEAGMIILIGIVAGMIIQLTFTTTTQHAIAKSLFTFSSDVFFVGLLPPIIFNSGYHLRRELFFRHFSPICMFAVLGTIISTFVVAGVLYFITSILHLSVFEPTIAELFTFGALISTTDPVTTLAVFQVKRVDPQLFYLVFGESALNDAIGLVLFQQFAKLIVAPSSSSSQKTTTQLVVSFVSSFIWSILGSPILGISLGIGISYLFKQIDMRKNALLELALYVFSLHVPYLLGEIFGLSGIVVILFTGITAQVYVVPNLSELTRINSDNLFRLVAFLAETAIFLELGLSVLGMIGSFHLSFISWALVACLFGRAANIYPLTALHNWTIRRKHGTDYPLERESEVASSVENETTTLLNNNRPTGLVRNVSMKTYNKMFYTSIRTPYEHGDLKIFPNCAHVMWFAGLRGAVAYACVRRFPDDNGHRDAFTITTMTIILATIFILGATTAFVLNKLDIETDVCEDAYLDTWSMERSLPQMVVKFENFILHHVRRPSDDDDDDVFVANDSNDQNIESDVHGISHKTRRRSSVSITKSVRFESQGIYDYGME